MDAMMPAVHSAMALALSRLYNVGANGARRRAVECAKMALAKHAFHVIIHLCTHPISIHAQCATHQCHAFN
jgi:hypothetical protein